jgi:putative ABC transport system permease protein
LPPADRRRPRRLVLLTRALALLARRDPRELLAISLEALARYRLRTALSVVGVVLGVAAVIAMMSVIAGAREDALRQVELLGLDNIVVRARGLAVGGAAGGGGQGLTTGDAEKLKALVPLAAFVTPLAERLVTVSGPGGRQQAVLLGVVPEYKEVLGLRVGRGRFLASLDLKTGARVCVLGATLGRALFGYRDPLGDSVRVGGEWHAVVGILTDRAADPGGVGPLTARNLNQAVLVPLSAVLGQDPAVDPRGRVEEVWIRIAEGRRVVEVGRVVEHTMKGLHRGSDDVEVLVPRQLLSQRFRTQRTFGVVVGSVAALSLLVGGIGIMNIMLASVLERTHEIGIRRTVGATGRDITLQFLVESLIMTLSGGVAGILAGVLVSFAITAYAGWTTSVSLPAVLLAVAVSVGVGLTFGIYPARRAGRLNPIDALRYE